LGDRRFDFDFGDRLNFFGFGFCQRFYTRDGREPMASLYVARCLADATAVAVSIYMAGEGTVSTSHCGRSGKFEVGARRWGSLY
jgi:hypothetical protein